MQTSLNGSNSLATDKNPSSSSYPALYSQCYSDSVERQTQNHFMAGFPFPSMPDYLCNTQPRYNIPSTENQENLSKSVLSNQNPFECNSSALNPPFEPINYSLPFDSNTRWDLTIQNPSMNEWVIRDFNSNNNNPGPSHYNNELSLSLATSQNVTHSIQEQCSEMSSSSLHRSYISSEHTSRSSDNLSLSCNSYKLIQFPPLSFGSRFFHAMQEILAEIACYALDNFDQTSYYSNTGGVTNNNGPKLPFSSDSVEVGAKMKHLLSLLQMVDDQYNRCLDEIHTVISAFHAVTELDPNLHARFALPTISLMYKNLRERISSHILEMGSSLSEREAREENSMETSFFQKQWALQQLRKRDDHQLWRPQRGLPERSVSVLRAWMFQNFLHPYPKDAEKHLLALKSGLTRSQVSNWFINARVRLWKPMIEEMCTEMNARKTRKNDEETDGGAQRNYMRFEKRR